MPDEPIETDYSVCQEAFGFSEIRRHVHKAFNCTCHYFMVRQCVADNGAVLKMASGGYSYIISQKPSMHLLSSKIRLFQSFFFYIFKGKSPIIMVSVLIV